MMLLHIAGPVLRVPFIELGQVFKSRLRMKMMDSMVTDVGGVTELAAKHHRIVPKSNRIRDGGLRSYYHYRENRIWLKAPTRNYLRLHYSDTKCKVNALRPRLPTFKLNWATVVLAVLQKRQLTE